MPASDQRRWEFRDKGDAHLKRYRKQKEAQDRYVAGISGSLDVVQAQEAVVNANETYIQALYLNNVAKLAPAHALGVAEQQRKLYLGGK